MTEQLKPCPFCGGGTTEITENGRVWTGMKWGEPSSVSVRHWCEEVPGQPSRMLERVGRDHEAAIAAWNCRAQPAQAGAEPVALSPEFTDGARAALLWVLWHHQGSSSPVGQPIRFALGMGAHQALSADQVAEAKRWAGQTGSTTAEFHARPPARVPLTDSELRNISKQQDPVVPLHHNVLAFAHAVIAAYEAKNGIGGGKWMSP